MTNRKLQNRITGELTTYQRFAKQWLLVTGKKVKDIRGAELRKIGYELIKNNNEWEVIQ